MSPYRPTTRQAEDTGAVADPEHYREEQERRQRMSKERWKRVRQWWAGNGPPVVAVSIALAVFGAIGTLAWMADAAEEDHICALLGMRSPPGPEDPTICTDGHRIVMVTDCGITEIQRPDRVQR